MESNKVFGRGTSCLADGIGALPSGLLCGRVAGSLDVLCCGSRPAMIEINNVVSDLGFRDWKRLGFCVTRYDLRTYLDHGSPSYKRGKLCGSRQTVNQSMPRATMS